MEKKDFDEWMQKSGFKWDEGDDGSVCITFKLTPALQTRLYTGQTIKLEIRLTDPRQEENNTGNDTG